MPPNMEMQHSSVQWDRVLGNRTILTELLLVQPWTTIDDVLQKGLTSSAAEAERLLEGLREAKIAEYHSYGYTCTAEVLNRASEFLPPQDDKETLRRSMRRNFNARAQEFIVRSTRDAFFSIEENDRRVFRPPWYFDLTAIIHPAFTIDRELRITACSNELCDFLRTVYPNLKAQVASNELGLREFLAGLDLHHFDYETLVPSSSHVLDPTLKFQGLLTHLAEHRSVDKKPALLKLGKIEHYLELSFALQVAFQGAQSIWHIVDQRVGQMRLIRAMRLTKWFITAHRLKQPTNLFNIARANLELTLESLESGIGSDIVKSDLANVIGSLTAGIQEFSRFVTEISKDEYHIASKLGTAESVDVLGVLEDVITDINVIYATPTGVQITVENCVAKDMSYFVQTSPFLMREALFNIVHNAFKHGARNAKSPSIYVRCACSSGALTLQVEDNGPGMGLREVEAYRHAFEEIRTSVTPTEVGALSGLSLAMSVVKNAGGSITFENVKPVGFRITLLFAGC